MLVTSVVLLTNPFTVDRWGPFYLHGWTLIPAGISNHKPSKMWDEITYPFPIVYVETFEGAECVISHFIMDVIPYPYVHVIRNTFNFICIPHGTWISDLFKHDLGPTIVLFQRFIMLLILKPTYENCNWSFQCFDIYKIARRECNIIVSADNTSSCWTKGALYSLSYWCLSIVIQSEGQHIRIFISYYSGW